MIRWRGSRGGRKKPGIRRMVRGMAGGIWSPIRSLSRQNPMPGGGATRGRRSPACRAVRASKTNRLRLQGQIPNLIQAVRVRTGRLSRNAGLPTRHPRACQDRRRGLLGNRFAVSRSDQERMSRSMPAWVQIKSLSGHVVETNEPNASSPCRGEPFAAARGCGATVSADQQTTGRPAVGGSHPAGCSAGNAPDGASDEEARAGRAARRIQNICQTE